MAKKELYKDWIVRYYGSHNDIPPGHTDGELTELIRCKDCKWYYRGGATCMFWDGENSMCGDDYCSRAERKEE